MGQAASIPLSDEHKTQLLSEEVILEGASANPSAPAEAKDASLSIMCWNLPTKGPMPWDLWECRLPLITKSILTRTPDIICMQEPHRQQTDDLAALLPAYSFVGRSRNEDSGSEYTPIFFNMNKLCLVNSGAFWLSEEIFRMWQVALLFSTRTLTIAVPRRESRAASY